MKAAITLDMKKNRIRIYKQTLQLLGDPEYIGMLVNVEDQSLIICQCGKDTKDAINVRVGRGTEIYSSKLCDELKSLNDRIKGNRLYRIYGDLYLEKMIVFKLSDI